MLEQRLINGVGWQTLQERIQENNKLGWRSISITIQGKDLFWALMEWNDAS